jgi:hypothetical protein
MNDVLFRGWSVRVHWVKAAGSLDDYTGQGSKSQARGQASRVRMAAFD